MENIRREFEDKKNKKLNEVSEDMKRLNNEIERKENDKNALIDKRNELKAIKNKKERFKEDQEEIFKEKFMKNKEDIDLEYSYLEKISYPIKEYSQQEKDLKNDLLKNIRRIKNYPIPECIMNNFGLMNYLY